MLDLALCDDRKNFSILGVPVQSINDGIIPANVYAALVGTALRAVIVREKLTI